MVQTERLYILFYEVVDDYLAKRAPFRDQHLTYARQAYERGELTLAGALATPADGAVLVFSTKEAAERFPKSDPYVINGLVTTWRIREWMTIVWETVSP